MGEPQGDSARPHRTRLREVVADCLEQIELDGPGAPDAIDAACARHPDLADEIRRRLARLRELGFSPAAASPWQMPRTLGDFDLGECIGSGGMGVVYHARQRSLARDVALKVMRPDLQWQEKVQSRFRREIEAVSRLQHPSIVQIHAVGEDQGIPYFAMEHVPGCTLAAVLERLRGRRPEELTGDDFWAAVRTSTPSPGRGGDSTIDTRLRGRSWIDTCIHVIHEAAVAIDHAHRRGVLHRDVKPQNVMVTPEGRVVVMDFGLAVTEGSQKLTRTGAALGSLIYMAPEQIEGHSDAIQATADVYGLGVTLFELLTLRPAFGEGTSEHADSEATIRRNILAGEFPRPRALSASLPWDVETVCLVAMERDPRRRYASAAAFAADLDRILQRRSIEGRRPGIPLRARRWVERHPAVSIAMLLLIVLSGVSFGFALRQRTNNRALKAALDDVSRQKERAENGLKRATSAIELMLTRFADTHLKNVPQFEQIRRSLLQDALTLQLEMLAEEGQDPQVRLETAKAYDRLSHLQLTLGQSEEALDSIAKSLQIREEFARSGSVDFLLLDQIALGHYDLGNTYREIGRWEDSERHFVKAIVGTEESLRNHPGELGFTRTLARCLHDYSITLEEQSRHEEAIASCRRAFTLIEPFAREQPTHEGLLNDVAAALQLQGMPLTKLGRHDEAVKCLTDALAWRQQLVALAPKELIHRQQLGLLLYALSFVLRDQDDVEEASTTIQDAIDVQRAILAEYPSAASVQWDLAQSLNEQGMVMMARLEPEAAIASLREAVRWYEPLVAAEPERPGYSHELGWALSNLAACILEQGEDAEAEKLVRRAIDLQSECVEKGPTIRIYQDRLLDHYRVLRDVFVARKDAASAAALAERAEQIAFVEPLRGAVARFRAATLARCADFVRDEDATLAADWDAKAKRALQETPAAASPDPGAPPADPDLEFLRARPAFAALLAPRTQR